MAGCRRGFTGGRVITLGNQGRFHQTNCHQGGENRPVDYYHSPTRYSFRIAVSSFMKNRTSSIAPRVQTRYPVRNSRTRPHLDPL